MGLLFVLQATTCLAQQVQDAGVPVQASRDQAWRFEATPSWQDEFDYSGLPDADKWSFEAGGHGWGNNELQYYTSGSQDNAQVADGVLTITAKKQERKGRDYTSARLRTKGKGDFLYGR
ncbi:MAG TPA: glycoside hydrolase family 16 protein, partial [Pseudoxanthomonas sp.]|nr:glycoside hydrolase family 16 protein [Pseudoxanthomonas sp.]